MSIDNALYASNQYRLAIKGESTIGTQTVATMQLVNIVGFPSINYGTLVTLDQKHGVGRTLKNVDVYSSGKGRTKEISFTCVWDQTVAPMLLANLFGIAAGTDPAGYEIDFDYTPSETANGGTGHDTNTGTLTVAVISPEGSNTQTWPGCIVDSIRVYCDNNSDGGRLMADVTLKTRYNILFNNAVPGTMSPYPATYRTIYDAVTKNSVFGVDAVLSAWEVTLQGNVKFYGYSTNGIPLTLARAVPNFNISGIFTVKRDANTEPLISSANGGSLCAVEISDNATWASATFGILGSYGRVPGELLSHTEVEEGAFFSIPVVFSGHTSGDVFEIIP